jgi:hypothetical protein
MYVQCIVCDDTGNAPAIMKGIDSHGTPAVGR